MKHSPGPYGITKHATHSAQFGIYSESNDSGGDLAIVCITGNDDETAANAALFAAAPELLENLIWLVDAAKTEPAMNIYKAHIERASNAIYQAVQS